MTIPIAVPQPLSPQPLRHDLNKHFKIRGDLKSRSPVLFFPLEGRKRRFLEDPIVPLRIYIVRQSLTWFVVLHWPSVLPFHL